MNYASLRKHLNALACIPETKAPVISAYFDLTRGLPAAMEAFRDWSSAARRTFSGDARTSFDDAVEEVVEWLPRCDGRGAAIFARWGGQPFFLPMNFEVPMETRFHAGGLPAIYPLVELKDRFNRFVVALLTSNSARIIEVNLGQQSLELLHERPALRERIGREWTREHYQNHKRDRDRRFLKEKITVIEGLMAKHGHNSLIVAGEPRLVNRFSEALPAHLRKRLVAEIKTGFTDQRVGELISQSVSEFLRAEKEDAHDAVGALLRAVRAGGLAAVGFQRTRLALEEGRAEHLFVSNSLGHDAREELVRLASRQGVAIETVQDCEMLDTNGGAGALLRFAGSPVFEEVRLSA